MIPAIREALAEFGHEFAIADARTLRTITEASIARERLAANLVAAFGVLAIRSQRCGSRSASDLRSR
jgi:hypothetical protein